MRRRRKNTLAGLLIAALLACIAPFVPWSTLNAPTSATAARRITVSAAEIKVFDGDTIGYKGDSVRMLGYDTPETAHPDLFKGAQEPWASRAADKLRALLDSAKIVELALSPAPDKYGRKLGYLYADGVPVGVPILQAGLAYQNVDHFGAQGFDSEAEQIRAAARSGAKPSFQEPYRWRAKNSLKPSGED